MLATVHAERLRTLVRPRRSPGWVLMLLACSTLLPALAMTACGDGRDELTVFAAISLRRPLEEIAIAFQAQHPGTGISFNFAGSQRLRFQLEQGAQAGVFVSADERQMTLAGESGVVAGEPLVFARGRLVIAVPKGNPAGIQKPDDLTSPGLRLVWADEAVPLGVYTRQAMAAMAPVYGGDFLRRVEARVVSLEESAAAVAGKVELGEADAAIVYQTDALRLVRAGATVIPIPDAYQPEVAYFAAALTEAKDSDLARAFVDFLLSNEAQRTLTDHGFLEGR